MNTRDQRILDVGFEGVVFIKHRGYVTPEDVKAVGPDVLRHRIFSALFICRAMIGQVASRTRIVSTMITTP